MDFLRNNIPHAFWTIFPNMTITITLHMHSGNISFTIAFHTRSGCCFHIPHTFWKSPLRNNISQSFWEEFLRNSISDPLPKIALKCNCKWRIPHNCFGMLLWMGWFSQITLEFYCGLYFPNFLWNVVADERIHKMNWQTLLWRNIIFPKWLWNAIVDWISARIYLQCCCACNKLDVGLQI